MTFVLRYPALATVMMASSVMGFAINAVPVQTVRGDGAVFSPAPTKAPSLELLRARLVKKAATNVCSEWTIPGGFGQPYCDASETCLFKTANGYFYEGCGQSGIQYDWVTACFNYPQSGTPPLSEIYCPKTAPYCGYYAFDYGAGVTAYNFGCDTASYGILVQRIATTSRISSASSYSYATASQSNSYTTSVTSTTSPSVSTTINNAAASTTAASIIGSHTVKVAIGVIAGTVVGGFIFLAILVGLAIWYCLRKRKQRKAVAQPAGQNLHQQANAASAAAFQQNQQIAEMGGSSVKPFVGAYAPTGHDKPGAMVGAVEVNGNSQPIQQSYAPTQSTGPTPPPVYAQPGPGPSPLQTPNQNYSELATPLSGPTRDISPMITPSQTPHPQVNGVYQPPPNQAGELVGDHRHSNPMPQEMYQQYQTPPAEMASVNNQPSLNPQPTNPQQANRVSWQLPPGMQEIGNDVTPQQYPPPPPPQTYMPQGPIQEMGPGVAVAMPASSLGMPVTDTSARRLSQVPRRPVGMGTVPPPVDMSGPRHELA